MGQCISKPPKKDHNQIMMEFQKQKQLEIEEKKQNLEKMNPKNLKRKSFAHRLSRNFTKNLFQMKDFINKNKNSLLEEYRYSTLLYFFIILHTR